MTSQSGAERAPAAPSLGEAAAAWVSSKRVRVDGSRIRYREAGSGSPIVLIHGLGVSADYWVRNGPALATAGFHVLAPDLPGFGRSGGRDQAVGIGAQAAAVRAWAAAIGLPPAVFVGHSLSCQTVVELAVHHPSMVRGLVLAAPTGDGESAGRLFRQAVGLTRDIRRESLLLATLVLQAYLRAGPVRVLRTWLHGADHDLMSLLPALRAPSIVVLGEQDPVVDREFATLLARGLPRGRLVVIAGAAHAVIFDRTGVFNNAVIEFARSLEGAVAIDDSASGTAAGSSGMSG
jgi:2-hydroxy-6-oxonona-2,4-dienedioate hydrolase